MRKAVVLVLVAVVIAALIYGWMANRAREEAELQLGLDSARVLSQSFAATNDLKVSTLSGRIVARSRDEGYIDALDVDQTLRAPFTADYFIDMGAIDLSDFAWNPDTRTMTIAIPDPEVAPPNIDMARADVRQSGLWVSRSAGMRLQRSAARSVSAKARQVANSPENVRKARAAARKAIAANAQAPLDAAGMGEVKVDVRFRSELNTNDDVWDYTLPYEEVLRRRQAMESGT